jgi:hypothetical protein
MSLGVKLTKGGSVIVTLDFQLDWVESTPLGVSVRAFPERVN